MQMWRRRACSTASRMRRCSARVPRNVPGEDMQGAKAVGEGMHGERTHENA